MGLAGMMGGTPSPEVGKQQAIAEIQERFPDPDTFEEFMELANAFSMGGFYSFAEAAIKAANDTRSSMPARTKTKAADDYYYWDDTGERVFTDVTKAEAEPKTFKSNDGTRYLNSGATWKAGDLVPGETEKTTLPTFENISLNNVLNDPEYKLAVKENRTLDANKLINTAYTNFKQAGSTAKPTYKTFTWNDESGNKVTGTYLVPASGVLAQDDEGNFIDKPVQTHTEARKKLKDGDTWKYVDDGTPVFSGTTTPDTNEKADLEYEKFFTANPALMTTPKGNKDFLLHLVKEGLTGSDKFTQIISSIDQDGINEIQRQAGIEKGIERLSVNYTKSDVGQMDSILKPIETQINYYMPHLTDVDGNLVYDRNGNALRDTSKGLPGWEMIKRYQRYFGTDETVRAAKNFAEDAQLLLNTIIKQRSGSAVSIAEAERLVKEYETGLPSSSSFANWVSAVRKVTEARRMGIVAGYSPEVQYGYFSQMGILPTLYDPENQEKQLPIGARWQDEAGNIFEKTQ
jgi:hypothetical protein